MEVTMQTVFLRFPDAVAALAAFRAITGDGADDLAGVPTIAIVSGLRIDVDVIGALEHDTGTVDAEGRAITEPVAGFHVNLWMPDEAVLPEALAPAVVHPVTPSRVFG